MVLAPFGPTVSVDPNGPNQQSAMAHRPVAQGGTVLESQYDSDLDANHELQGPAVQHNPWQEFQAFVGELCRIYGLAPAAAVVRIEAMCAAWRNQTYHA